MIESWQNDKRRIAIVGKGGTGKSALTTLIAKTLLHSRKLKTLMIDADPAMGLSHILQIKPKKTIEDLRNEIVAAASKGGKKQRIQTVTTLDYKVFEALVETRGFAFLSMGQPTVAGCFCPTNELLRESMETLSSGFDFVLIDCEAGLEQISRKVIGSIDTVVVTTDLSLRGTQAAKSIAQASRRHTGAHRIGLVINRVKNGGGSIHNIAHAIGLDLFGWIPEDDQLAEWDNSGRSLMDLPVTSPAVAAVNGIVEAILSTGDVRGASACRS